ncbi:hypothetical protein CDL12_14694 [Handroanthus impetiginosus]|uniref:FAR1 domain-containing protein n=1 Tax=Handroanthus impetiginosus TaxID=429701 RepID=A0A2G9H592_9LAMI|nr:hypothetical protein CDL12_14694 [Handroanthus impetiginosus]
MHLFARERDKRENGIRNKQATLLLLLSFAWRENYEEVETTNKYKGQSTFVESSLPKSQEVQFMSSIIDELESRLAVGQFVKSVEDAYFLYCDYAHAKGFSVRKGDQCYFPCNNELQAKEFECLCGGAKDKRRSHNRISVYQKPTIKTKCKARLRIG